jgi:tRNA-dihydrouridine synthase B
VTLKMRLGWDDAHRNAPALAQIAERKGVQMLTVHGRTRCQFYTGAATGRRCAKRSRRYRCRSSSTAISAMWPRRAGAGAVRRAWRDGRARGDGPALAAGRDRRRAGGPPLADAGHGEQQCDSLAEQIADSLALYGPNLGLRMARKHVSAAIDHLALSLPAASGARFAPNSAG